LPINSRTLASTSGIFVSIGAIGLIKAVSITSGKKSNWLPTPRAVLKNSDVFAAQQQNPGGFFDEPLNIDWDGNRLLLSDVLEWRMIPSTGTLKNRWTASCSKALEAQ
jgi:hypothetical protein